MSKHVDNWLQAYYDDELKGKRRKIVEKHLEKCDACSHSLAELSNLSQLLSEGKDSISVSKKFVSQVMLQLPRKNSEPRWKQATRFIYSAIPAVLFFVLVFIHATSLSNNLLIGAELLGLGGEDFSALAVNPLFSGFIDFMDLVNIGFLDMGSTIWEVIGSVDLLGIDLVYTILLPLLIGALAISWMIGWWVMDDNKQESIIK